MGTIHPHHSTCKEPWTWTNFTPQELSCKHCGEYYHDPASLDALQALRNAWGKPLVINSAHRCAAHNRAIGGAKASRHLRIAFDCRCPATEQQAFAAAAEKAGFTGIGTYPSKGFVHVDTGPKREWNG